MFHLKSFDQAAIVKEVLKEFVISAKDAEVELTLGNFEQWVESIYADYDDEGLDDGTPASESIITARYEV